MFLNGIVFASKDNINLTTDNLSNLHQHYFVTTYKNILSCVTILILQCRIIILICYGIINCILLLNEPSINVGVYNMINTCFQINHFLLRL